MSEENKALARRVVEEVWNRGNVAVVDETFAPDYTEHNPRRARTSASMATRAASA